MVRVKGRNAMKPSKVLSQTGVVTHIARFYGRKRTVRTTRKLQYVDGIWFRFIQREKQPYE